MQSMETPVVIDYREGAYKGDEENIEKVNEDFISTKGNLGISQILKKEVAEKQL